MARGRGRGRKLVIQGNFAVADDVGMLTNKSKHDHDVVIESKEMED